MKKEINVQFIEDDTIIVTENADGRMYILRAKYIRDILDDWNGDCEFVPSNDARVFFAAWNGKPINPYAYTDFESLLKLSPEERERYFHSFSSLLEKDKGMRLGSPVEDLNSGFAIDHRMAADSRSCVICLSERSLLMFAPI